MAKKENQDIREALRKRGMYIWNLAELVGVSEQTVIRWLRRELPEERKKELLRLIEES